MHYIYMIDILYIYMKIDIVNRFILNLYLYRVKLYTLQYGMVERKKSISFYHTIRFHRILLILVRAFPLRVRHEIEIPFHFFFHHCININKN